MAPTPIASQSSVLLVSFVALLACSKAGSGKTSDNTGGTSSTNVPDASVPANAIWAKSCLQSDVQSALDGAKAGSVVIVPAGTCTWGDQESAVTIDKAITLQGLGRGTSTIELSTSAAAWTSGTIQLNAAATVKSLTIRTSTNGNSGTAFSASVDGFRISDIEFISRTELVNGYFLYADAYGLIDNCSLTGSAGNNELIFARGRVDSWQTESSMGSEDNLFIEDCVFSGTGYVCDCNSNARCVVRFNTITGPMKVDGHGKASNDPPRGVRQMEIYENEWTDSGAYHSDIELRGGTGRVFHNRASVVGQWLILHEYSATSAWPNFDGVIQTTYPIDDQIGLGMDPKSGGSEPMYLWGNRAGGELWPISLGYGDDAILSAFIRSDRDYFTEVATFDGSSGVGSGTGAQMRELTPSLKGVGFWVSDEGDWNEKTPTKDGTLYVWDGSNWKVAYMPHSYPHPLRSTP